MRSDPGTTEGAIGCCGPSRAAEQPSGAPSGRRGVVGAAVTLRLTTASVTTIWSLSTYGTSASNCFFSDHCRFFYIVTIMCMLKADGRTDGRTDGRMAVLMNLTGLGLW